MLKVNLASEFIFKKIKIKAKKKSIKKIIPKPKGKKKKFCAKPIDNHTVAVNTTKCLNADKKQNGDDSR